jgi:hypothetical protein
MNNKILGDRFWHIVFLSYYKVNLPSVYYTLFICDFNFDIPKGIADIIGIVE